MFDGPQIVEVFRELGITHVVMIPDSTLGEWDPALSAVGGPQLVRVCREGEAWLVAAGLYLGGAQPIVVMQCTGLFESGDALRNVVHDWKIPVFALIGYRSYLNQEAIPGDTCLVFTEPVLDAWALDYKFMDAPDKVGLLAEHYRACADAGKAGAVLMAEGRA